MRKSNEHFNAAESGVAARFRAMFARIARYLPAGARWTISAALALIAPLAFVAESASASIAEAVTCIGNGPLMALAASANALTLVP